MLHKMRVLSFTHFVQGPSGAQYLADMGADVIKVEPPTGSFERRLSSGGIEVDGKSVTFMTVNRNKRSLAIDLKHPRAKEVLHPLIEQCDVIMENYRAGVLDRLGFGYEAVKAIKPDIIYASATGWGSSGPLADKPGVDLLVQARSGLISVTGKHDSPSIVGMPIVDHHGGALFAMGVMAAYIKKLTTGEGTRVESSLLNAGLDLQAESLALYRSACKTQENVRRHERLGVWFMDAPHGIFQLADCHAVIAINGNMEKFTEVIGNHALAVLGPQGRSTLRDRYMDILAKELRGWTYARLEETLRPHGFWFERVATYDDVIADEQIKHNQSFTEVKMSNGAAATVLKHPNSYDGKVPGVQRNPPELGEHTEEILREAGFSEEQIAGLFKDAAVYAG